MKKIAFLLIVGIAFLIQLAVMAKDKEVEVILPRNAEGKVQYQEVIEVPGVQASVLFARAKNWCAQAFVSVKDTLQNEDAAAGRLTYKGNFQVPAGLGVTKTMCFTMNFEVKDGKTRITITGFYISNYATTDQYPLEKALQPDGTAKTGWAKIVVTVNEQAKSMTEDIKNALATQEENW